MKKILSILILVLMAICIIVAPIVAMAEANETDVPEADVGNTATDIEVPAEPFTWQYLVTITGAAAFTLLVVQFLKAPLDKVWKIPTRVFAYIIALVVMLVATAFTSGLTVDSVLLVAANAFLAAMSAYGAYELTFAKLNK